MFKNFLLFSVIFLAAIAETSLFPHFLPFYLLPDLVLILVILWVSRSGFDRVWARAVIAGLILDALTFQPVGLHIIAFTIVAFGVNSLAKRFLVAHKSWGFLVALGFIALGSLANFVILNAFLGVIERLTGDKAVETFSFLLVRLAWNTLSNVLLFSIIYWPFVRIEKIINLYSRNMLPAGRFGRTS